MLGGQKALAQFVNEGFLKNEPVYVCGDRSRQKFYIVKDGKKTEDTNCDAILDLTTPGFHHVTDVYKDALESNFPEQVTETDIQDNYRDIIGIHQNRTEFKSELSRIVPTEEVTMDPKKQARKTLKEAVDEMEKALIPYGSRTTPMIEQPSELVRRPDVLGYSPGKLMAYRDRFRKNGEVTYPSALTERLQNDKEAMQVYMTYLHS